MLLRRWKILFMAGLQQLCNYAFYIYTTPAYALCGQHRTVPDFDVAAICQTPGRSWWVRLPSNIKEKGMGCLANRRKGVLVFWWLGRDGTDRTGACTGEKN